MATNSTEAGLAATVGSNAQEVYDTWGGSYAQRRDLGRDWIRVNPYPAITHVGPQGRLLGLKKLSVPAGPVYLLSRPATGTLYEVTSSTEPFVRLATVGKLFGRLADSAGKDLEVQQAAGHLYCTVANCGQCPPRTAGTPPPSEPLSMPLLIGLSGGSAYLGEVVLTGEPWSKYCRPLPPPPPVVGSISCRQDTSTTRSAALSSGGGDCAFSGGDPHVLTFAGDEYDFQGAGELPF